MPPPPGFHLGRGGLRNGQLSQIPGIDRHGLAAAGMTQDLRVFL